MTNKLKNIDNFINKKMEQENKIIKTLLEEGFKEISKFQLRTQNFKEIIEYFDGITWRDFGKKWVTKIQDIMIEKQERSLEKIRWNK